MAHSKHSPFGVQFLFLSFSVKLFSLAFASWRQAADQPCLLLSPDVRSPRWQGGSRIMGEIHIVSSPETRSLRSAFARPDQETNLGLMGNSITNLGPL